MSKFFGRFKKEEIPVMEEQVPVWEDRIFWVETLQKIALPVLMNLKKDSLRKNMIIESYEMLSTFIKDKGFKEEKEVRFAFKACYAHLLKSLNEDFKADLATLISTVVGAQIEIKSPIFSKISMH